MKRSTVVYFLTILVLIFSSAIWYKSHMTDVVLTGVPSFDKLEIVKTGQVVVIKPAGQFSGTTVVTHNLGYKPIVMAFSGDEGGTALPDFTIFTNGTDSGKIWRLIYYSQVTETSVTFGYDSPSIGFGSGPELTADVTYYLLRRIAN